MKLTLPFPPSVNGYWRSPNRGVLKGRHMVSARGRKFQRETYGMVLDQLKKRPNPITDHISVSVVLFPPTKAKRDLDNFFKALFDALTKSGVWVDDSQIKKLTAQWGEVVKEGRVEIEIVELSKCA